MATETPYATMRNKRTGEIRDVGLDEFTQLQKEVTPEGFPAWEQTSYAHAEDLQTKASYGALLEEHLGEDFQKVLKHEALVKDAEGVGPEQNPHLQLTPGEIEEGLTPKDKLEQLRKEYAPNVPKREDLIQKANEAVAPGGDVKPQGGPGESRGLRARAGGSDERQNVPVADASDGKSKQAMAVSGQGEGEQQLTGEELKQRAAELNIEGRSQMNADELRDAVNKAESEGEQE